MKKIIAISGILIVAGVVYLSLNKQIAYAATAQRGNGQGLGRQQMLSERAGILKMSVSDLQSKLSSGKTCSDIAKAQGVNMDAMHAQMVALQTTRLQALVDQGTMTNEQMQERLDSMKQRQASCGKNIPMSGQGGCGMGMHR